MGIDKYIVKVYNKGTKLKMVIFLKEEMKMKYYEVEYIEHGEMVNARVRPMPTGEGFRILQSKGSCNLATLYTDKVFNTKEEAEAKLKKWTEAKFVVGMILGYDESYVEIF